MAQGTTTFITNPLFSLSPRTPSKITSFNHFITTRFFSPLSPPSLSSLQLRPSSSMFIVHANSNPIDSISIENEKEISHSSANLLACPVCYQPLTWITDPRFSIDAIPGSTLQCSTCQKTYAGNQTHIDLITTGETKNNDEPMPLSTELFRLPLVSYLYERGWRQTFTILGGFPGAEKEFEIMKGFLKPVLGGNILDASCGSGLFSKLFAKSGLFSLVVALDYSENMLKQCYEFIQQEENFPKENFTLVRADISKLPFVSNSIDAVHAGAAIHCWPSPSAAIAEITRVLRPGGVFVATTFVLDGPLSYVPFLNQITKNTGGFSFLSERELEDFCRASGLVQFKCIRNRRFVMISATKPI
ncbi:putative demethylmenaquinone methyltransferase [Lupinus albus]|uniref:Putative demethylmenaquinone methyltransferase n=1 Tax=Lupinus albus TaxID=3870 RepID=A0A6A4NCG3_LUPAL|nr:putative demethylmenaquinone methyltransferase [Lupinus albus]